MILYTSLKVQRPEHPHRHTRDLLKVVIQNLCLILPESMEKSIRNTPPRFVVGAPSPQSARAAICETIAMDTAIRETHSSNAPLNSH